MLGQKICKLENFLFGKWIRCDQCICYKEKEEEDEILRGIQKVHYCANFKDHKPLNWQYCFYFKRKEPLKHVKFIKWLLKSIWLWVWTILRLPFYPIIKIKRENNYLKERVHDLLREKYQEEEFNE